MWHSAEVYYQNPATDTAHAGADMCHSVINKCSKWDPNLPRPTCHPVTAQHGGDIQPSSKFITKMLSNIEDQHDNMEPEPEPHYFDAYPSPTAVPPLVRKGSALNKTSYKTTPPLAGKGSVLKGNFDRNDFCHDIEQTPGDLSPFVPMKPKVNYSGPSQLRFSGFFQGINTRIPYCPMKGKKYYLSVEYPSDYVLPEQPTSVELPTNRKKTEPVQEAVPRVKLKSGTSCQFQRHPINFNF